MKTFAEGLGQKEQTINRLEERLAQLGTSNEELAAAGEEARQHAPARAALDELDLSG